MVFNTATFQINIILEETKHKMKKKLSVTISEEKLKEIAKRVQEGRFRNKSHVIEYSLDQLLKEEGK